MSMSMSMSMSAAAQGSRHKGAEGWQPRPPQAHESLFLKQCDVKAAACLFHSVSLDNSALDCQVGHPIASAYCASASSQRNQRVRPARLGLKVSRGCSCHQRPSRQTVTRLAHLNGSMRMRRPAHAHLRSKYTSIQGCKPASRNLSSAACVARTIQVRKSSFVWRRGPANLRSIDLSVDLSCERSADVKLQDSQHHSRDIRMSE